MHRESCGKAEERSKDLKVTGVPQEAGVLIITLQVWTIRARAAKCLPSSLCGSRLLGQHRLLVVRSTALQQPAEATVYHPASAPPCSLRSPLPHLGGGGLPLLVSILYVSPQEKTLLILCQYSAKGSSSVGSLIL